MAIFDGLAERKLGSVLHVANLVHCFVQCCEPRHGLTTILILQQLPADGEASWTPRVRLTPLSTTTVGTEVKTNTKDSYNA